jgi:malate synthase
VTAADVSSTPSTASARIRIRRPRPTECHHRYPRLDKDCGRSADYVIDYASGIGACAEHLGKELAWVMEDCSTAQVYRIEMWIHLHADDDARADEQP